MTELRTDRLVLRRARSDDLEAMHAVLSDQQAMRYWSTGPHSDLAETERWLDSMLTSPREISDDFVVTLDGEVIGKMGAWRLPEFGFILRSDLWGRGYAGEAMAAFLAHMFRTRGVEFLTTDVDPRNTPSLKLLADHGFVETGRAKGTWETHIGLCDSVYLRLDLETWRQRCLAEAEARARLDYSQPGRFYHDQRHLDDCLRQLERIDELSERQRRLLRWAILWHDVVYDPRRGDNEERSAERAERELIECGVGEDDAAEVARLILLTKGHRADEADRLGALMASIDLSILGSAPKRYRAYAEAVRKEYGHLPDEDWRSGRQAVLNRLLAADPLYPDPGFRAALEAQARLNIEAELKALRAG